MHYMVQKHMRSAGRPPQYERDQVIAKAMDAFWRDGYEATTLSDLEEATGLDRSSIYNSFGGKSGLYDMVIESYLDRGRTELFAPLIEGTSGIADLVEFLDRLQAMQADDSTPTGCMVTNDLCRPGNAEPTGIYLEMLRAGVVNTVKRSNQIDQTNPNLNTARCETLMASVVGVNLLHHHDPSSAEMVDGLRDLVRSWAVDRSAG